MVDNVNHPKHYETGKFECIDVMVETQGADAVRDFCVCNALKYLYRHRRKNGIEDIKKAIWYLVRYVKLSETKPTETTCVVCGRTVPEGRHVCPDCERKDA